MRRTLSPSVNVISTGLWSSEWSIISETFTYPPIGESLCKSYQLGTEQLLDKFDVFLMNNHFALERQRADNGDQREGNTLMDMELLEAFEKSLGKAFASPSPAVTSSRKKRPRARVFDENSLEAFFTLQFVCGCLTRGICLYRWTQDGD